MILLKICQAKTHDKMKTNRTNRGKMVVGGCSLPRTLSETSTSPAPPNTAPAYRTKKKVANAASIPIRNRTLSVTLITRSDPLASRVLCFVRNHPPKRVDAIPDTYAAIMYQVGIRVVSSCLVGKYMETASEKRTSAIACAISLRWAMTPVTNPPVVEQTNPTDRVTSNHPAESWTPGRKASRSSDHEHYHAATGNRDNPAHRDGGHTSQDSLVHACPSRYPCVQSARVPAQQPVARRILSLNRTFCTPNIRTSLACGAIITQSVKKGNGRQLCRDVGLKACTHVIVTGSRAMYPAFASLIDLITSTLCLEVAGSWTYEESHHEEYFGCVSWRGDGLGCRGGGRSDATLCYGLAG